MKCEYCGSDLSIEYEKCPYCDALNPFYEAHRKDMKAYARKYAATEKQVVEKTNRFAKKSVRITIIAVLVIINLVFGILFANIWEIRNKMHENANKRDAAKTVQMANDLEFSKDYLNFDALMDEKYYSYYKGPHNEFSMVMPAADDYVAIVKEIARLVDGSAYGNESEIADSIGRRLDYLYRDRDEINKATYEAERYAKRHRDAVEDIVNETHKILAAYLGLDKETVDSFEEMTSAERKMIIEKAVKEVYFNEED